MPGGVLLDTMRTPTVHPAPPGTRRLVARHVPEVCGLVSLALLMDGWMVEVRSRGQVVLRSGGHPTARAATESVARTLGAPGPWTDRLAQAAEPGPPHAAAPAA